MAHAGRWRTIQRPVEIDETYVGGREKNRHAEWKHSTPKTPVVGMKDRSTGQVRAKPVPETTATRLGKFVEDTAEADATHYTDENRAYLGLKNHHTVCRRSHEYGNGEIHINGMESFWALLKRGYIGTHHYMSPKHLHRYVNEFAGRLNLTKMRLEALEMLGMVAACMIGRRLTYQALIGELCT